MAEREGNVIGPVVGVVRAREGKARAGSKGHAAMYDMLAVLNKGQHAYNDVNCVSSPYNLGHFSFIRSVT